MPLMSALCCMRSDSRYKQDERLGGVALLAHWKPIRCLGGVCMTGRACGEGLPGMCCLFAKPDSYLEQGSIVEHGSASAELGLTLHPCLL